MAAQCKGNRPGSTASTRSFTKQFERVVRQAYLIVSQTAWLNGRRKSEKLPALPQPTDEPRTPKVFASRLTRTNTNAVEPLNSKNILASGREPHYCSTMTENRIEIDPNVMMGKPIIRGTRIAVELILRKLSEGAT
jgi:Protein of unknown function (DUF433)